MEIPEMLYLSNAHEGDVFVKLRRVRETPKCHCTVRTFCSSAHQPL